MRSVVLFCVLLALTAFLLSVSAQPRHENIIVLYNDSTCTQHVDTIRIPERNTTRCEAEEGPRNASSRFECADRNNVTHLFLEFFENTTTCSDRPMVSMMSTGPAHSCAAVAITFETNKTSLYGHIECAPPNMTHSIRQVASPIKEAVNRHMRATPARAPAKSFFASIFGL